MSIINVNVHFFFPKIKLIKLNHDVKFIFYRTLLRNRGDRELIVILMKRLRYERLFTATVSRRLINTNFVSTCWTAKWTTRDWKRKAIRKLNSRAEWLSMAPRRRCSRGLESFEDDVLFRYRYNDKSARKRSFL